MMPIQVVVKDSKSEPEAPSTSGISLTWSNVSWSVPLKKKQTKTIIEDMSGSIKAGQIVSILGGSGAGKSTLLNALSGRLKNGKLLGKILLNGKPRDPKSWRKICAYVEQDDLMFNNLTVYETLMYSALLRLPSSMLKSSKIDRVNEIIGQLGLEDCRNTRIGSRESRGISGGERKRVSIGIELVTSPKLLFLDEPTSGLDAFNAFNVMETIKNVAVANQMVILCTIHQPRTELLELFNSLILLSAGKTVYFGPLTGALDHFETLGYILPPKTNPSDFFLDIITPDLRSEDQRTTSYNRIDKFKKEWQQVETTDSPLPQTYSDIKVSGLNSWFLEFYVLLERNLIDVSRDVPTLGATIGQGLFIMLLMGFLFFKVNLEPAGVQNRIGVLFFICVNQTFGVVMPTLAVFPLARQIIKREMAAATYRSSSAYLAKVISTIPLTVLGSLLLTIPVYWMIGLQNDLEKYVLFNIIVVVHSLTANSLGIAIGSIVPSVQVGQIIGPIFISILLLFGGQIVNLETLPAVFKWIQWVSPISYSNKALSQVEFTGLVFTCSDPFSLCYKNGEQVLKVFNFDTVTMADCLLINIGIQLATLLAGFVFFSWTSRTPLKLN